jgi:hypothetical protein
MNSMIHEKLVKKRKKEEINQYLILNKGGTL